MDPSGIRIGTPALTTRGMGTDEMQQIGGWMLTGAATAGRRDPTVQTYRPAVAELCQSFPVPGLACETV